MFYNFVTDEAQSLMSILLIITVKSIAFSAVRCSLLSCPKIAHATTKVMIPLRKEKAVL